MNGSAAARPGERPGRKVWWGAGGVAALALALGAVVTLSEDEAEAPASEPRPGAVATAVQLAEARQADLDVTIRYHGELWTEVAELAAQQTGRLEAVDAQLGERVQKGAILARVDAAQLRRQIDEAVAQVNAARADEKRVAAEIAAAQVELERGERLVAERLIASQELDARKARTAVLAAESQAVAARAEQSAARAALLREQLREASLRAPFDGAVAARHLDPGALVQPGTPVLRLVKSGPLRVRFRVPERDLSRVRVGQAIAVATQATGGHRYAGEVTRLSPEISAQDRMLAVEGVLREEPELLRTGMHAEVLLTVQALSGVTVIPPAAIVERTLGQRREQGAYVVDDGVAHFRPLTLLGRSGERSAVEGLDPGERVVTLGHEGLQDGARVNVRAAHLGS